jgi:hypothetical protein
MEGEPGEIASAAVLLAFDASNYNTEQAVNACGSAQN